MLRKNCAANHHPEQDCAGARSDQHRPSERQDDVPGVENPGQVAGECRHVGRGHLEPAREPDQHDDRKAGKRRRPGSTGQQQEDDRQRARDHEVVRDVEQRLLHVADPAFDLHERDGRRHQGECTRDRARRRRP